MSVLEARGIDPNVDVSSDPELLALALEEAYQEVVVTMAVKMAETHAAMTQSLIEDSDLRSGSKVPLRDLTQYKSYKAGTPEGDAYIRSLGLNPKS